MRGLFEFDELCGPHLVLANARDVDGLGASDRGQLRDHFLGSHETVSGFGPSKRVGLAQAVQVTPPPRKVGLAEAFVGLGKSGVQCGQGGLEVRNHCDVGIAVL